MRFTCLVPTALVAFATSAAFADLDVDDRTVVPLLAERGVAVEAAVWDDPPVDWGRFDLVVLRSTWDYPGRAEEFVAWTRSVPRLANPADVVAWNVDKHYLGDLATAGVPIVPTTFVAPGDPVAGRDAAGDVVVKPTVSCGSRDTARLGDEDAIAALIDHIHASGRAAMVQPYLDAIDSAGETALVFLGGAFSHAARKAPLLTVGAPLVEGPYAEETMSPREASADELAVAHAALAAVPADEPLLYARVDLVPGDDGRPVVLEVELTEPSLFLALGDASATFAEAINRVVTSRRREARGRGGRRARASPPA